ncbi:hypothetical protein CGC20_27315 [Leishmania donovani]|uniref:Uncharacterized protein n=1 Tax=Leishmania donovani TaxID=5661 RepID=A0A504Y684_LEIDO|nr:hypothetical protein CGC20_27315 [Leishmania donovani]
MRQFSYRTARTATASLAANATLIPVRNCYDSSRVGRGDAAAAAASSSSPSVYRTSALFTTVLPAVLQVGVPVLLRVFAHQLPAPISLVPLPFQPSSSASSSTADAVIVPQVQFEYFRVERFIPVAMQMEADARHLYEFRHTNKVEGVCYVCHEVDRAMYISLMEEQRTVSVELEELLREVRGKGRRTEAKEEKAAAAAFFNQYVLDELGMAGELLADSRSKNGA